MLSILFKPASVISGNLSRIQLSPEDMAQLPHGTKVKIRTRGVIPPGLRDDIVYFVFATEEANQISLCKNQSDFRHGNCVPISGQGEGKQYLHVQEE